MTDDALIILPEYAPIFDCLGVSLDEPVWFTVIGVARR